MMRGVMAILLAIIIPMSLAATSAAAQRDSVRGTAQHLGADPPFPVIKVHIKALADASGTNPRGSVTAVIKSLDVNDRARVVCLSVVGNRATVGTEIVKSNDPALEGQGQLWSVVDNGESGVDRIAGHPITSTPPTVCPPLFFNVPVLSGNYVVHDTTP
jgi:hypothetical protein